VKFEWDPEKEKKNIKLHGISFVPKGFDTHMRLLRDEQPVKRREPFPFRIGTKSRNLMHVFKQSRETVRHEVA
jgi:uncharacterized DUF497 family protein